MIQRQLHHQQACPITCDNFKDVPLDFPAQLAGGSTKESPLTEGCLGSLGEGPSEP